jgi:hypothetical protein
MVIACEMNHVASRLPRWEISLVLTTLVRHPLTSRDFGGSESMRSSLMRATKVRYECIHLRLIK